MSDQRVSVWRAYEYWREENISRKALGL